MADREFDVGPVWFPPLVGFDAAVGDYASTHRLADTDEGMSLEL